MENVKGFFDLGVSEECMKFHYEHTINLLYDYGYRTVAINQILNAENMESGQSNKRNKKKGEAREEALDPVPEPFKIKPVKGCEEMKILNRLTVAFSNQEVLHKITKSPNYKKFHLIAAQPTTTSAFMFTCGNFEADILSFDSENRNELKKNRKLYNQLIERGYHFEICYSEAIEDAFRRKHIIHLSHVYHSLFKSKNIIISSGATRPIFIRSPYDVINLGFIFGLTEQQSKSAITHCPRKAYINSVGRSHGKAVMFVEMSEPTKETSVILLESSSDSDVVELMEEDRPPSKKQRNM